MNGRLIFSFKAEIFRLDTVAIAAVVPDADVHSDGGFDEEFDEPTLKDEGDKIGTVQRKEKTAILVPCQVEDQEFESQQQTATGDVPNTFTRLVFHINGLKELGLLDLATGLPKIHKNDRVARILDKCDNVSTVFPRGGYFITEVRPTSYGIGQTQNLFLAVLQDREVGPTR